MVLARSLVEDTGAVGKVVQVLVSQLGSTAFFGGVGICRGRIVVEGATRPAADLTILMLRDFIQHSVTNHSMSAHHKFRCPCGDTSDRPPLGPSRLGHCCAEEAIHVGRPGGSAVCGVGARLVQRPIA